MPQAYYLRCHFRSAQSEEIPHLRLEGGIILYQNVDKLGMLASVSGLLAQKDINIAALSLGRSKKGSNAITAVSVDKHLNESERSSIHKLEGIKNIRYISLS